MSSVVRGVMHGVLRGLGALRAVVCVRFRFVVHHHTIKISACTSPCGPHVPSAFKPQKER